MVKFKRPIIFLVLAISLGLIATRQISKYIESKVQRDEGTKKVAAVVTTQGVVVAGADISWGTRLTDEQLTVTLWPREGVPEGAFLEKELLIGRSAKTALVKGEPILESKLAAEGHKGGITGIIPDGTRAITIRVNEVAGVAGFVSPGSRVDIILTLDMKTEEGSQTVTKVLLENMLVLAVDQEMNQDENNPVIVNAVTLLASPEEAERLTLASNKGSLQLAMRNGMDPNPVATAGIGLGDLLNMDTNEVAADAPSHKLAVEVIKGTERSEVKF